MKISPTSTVLCVWLSQTCSIFFIPYKQVSGVSLHWFIITVVLSENSPNPPAYQWLTKNYL